MAGWQSRLEMKNGEQDLIIHQKISGVMVTFSDIMLVLR
ncbi:hypothetical protein pb186bvf_005144 [Paramecium bursaria]